MKVSKNCKFHYQTEKMKVVYVDKESQDFVTVSWGHQINEQTLAENKLCDRWYQYINRDIFVAYNIKAKKNNRRLLWVTELYPDIRVVAKTRDMKWPPTSQREAWSRAFLPSQPSKGGLTLQLRTSHCQDCNTMYFCCLGHPVCGALFR